MNLSRVGSTRGGKFEEMLLASIPPSGVLQQGEVVRAERESLDIVRPRQAVASEKKRTDFSTSRLAAPRPERRGISSSPVTVVLESASDPFEANESV